MGTTAAWSVSGAGSKIQVESGGTLTANNLVTVTNFVVDDGGTYVHNAASAASNGSANDIPGGVNGGVRTFGASSTVEIQKWANGGTSPTPLPSPVNWGNLKINVASLGGSWNQIGSLTNNAGGNGVKGDLIIAATGGTTREFRLIANSPAPPLTPTLTVAGSLKVSGGLLTIVSGTGTPTLNVTGNLEISGGVTALATSTGVPTVTVTGQLLITGGLLTSTGAGVPVFTVNGNSGKVTATGGGTLMMSGDFATAPGSPTADQLTLDNGGYGAAGANFTNSANRGITVTANNGSLVCTSAMVFIPSVVSGPGGLTKIGSGGVTFNAANSFGGGFSVAAGQPSSRVYLGSPYGLGTGTMTINSPTVVVALTNGPALTGANAVTNSIVLNNNMTPSLTGAPTVEFSGPITLNTSLYTIAMGSSDVIFSGVISGSGGPGGIVRQNANGRVIFQGPSAFTCTNVQFNAGTNIVSGGNDRLPAGCSVIVGTGANNAVWILGDGSSPVNQTVAELMSQSSGVPRVMGGNAANSTLTVNPQSNVKTFSGVIGGDGPTDNNIAFTVNSSGGASGIVLSGANTYVGDTTITAGKLELGGNERLPSGVGKGNVIVNGQLSLGGFNQTVNNLSGGGSVTTTAGTPTLTVNSLANSTFSGPIGFNGGITTDNISLTKQGGGTLILSGTSTYTGATTISAGTLRVDGSLGATAVTVSPGATLGGGGTIGGSVSVSSGGSVGAGASAGSLTLNNGLNLSAGGTNVWELAANLDTGAGNNFDQITLAGGNLVLGGTSRLLIKFIGASTLPNNSDSFWQSSHNWTIINGPSAGNPGSSNFSGIDGTNGITSGGTFSTSTGSGGTIVLTYTPAGGGATAVTSFSIASGPGSDLTLSYSGGSGSRFVLLQTNNVVAPVSGWTRVRTNTTTPGSFTITPGVDPLEFYRVKSE
jgi:autotransporter-associated beta strand protein